MKIEKVPLGQLTPDPDNAKEHTPKQIAQIKASIERFGNNDPIAVWGKDNLIVEGHGRYEALKALGYKEAEIIRLDRLTDEERRAYALAHNQLTMNTGWLDGILEKNLDAIESIDMADFGFDVADYETPAEIVEDEAPEIDEQKEPTAKRGDIYQLGKHRLICGDATDKKTVERLMNGEKVDLVFTDPPYNVDYEGKTDEKLKIQNDHFESDEDAGEKLWRPAFENMRSVAKDCCALYCCMPQGSTHMMMMMMMMMMAGWQIKHELIWEKQSIVLNRADYNYQHEPIAYGWNKTHKFYAKGKYHTTSVWKFDRPTKSKEHPTMKPVELICEAILNSSGKDAAVLDLFGGSGSTLIACEQLGRKCYMAELDPKYCDVIIQRWENFTGKKAELLNE